MRRKMKGLVEMKAVIMAGGEGRRLRPITCTVPKPMVKLLGRPIIEHIFDLLISSGVTEVAVTLGYLPHLIEREYENGYGELEINFVREDEPLGTAGSVRNASVSFKEPFIVISGDAVCDVDLKKVMKYHLASGAAVTVVAKQVRDPREYGVVCVGDDNRIRSFIEKPSWSQAISNLANTGIYIVNPECMSLIPKNRKFDFAADLFPLMLEKDLSIFCYNTADYWCDVGNTDAFLECQKDAFDGKIKLDIKSAETIVYQRNYTVIEPSFIGKETEISEGAVIGPYAVVGSGCYIGRNAKIRYSCVQDNCCFAPGSAVTGAIVCSGAALRKGASMFEGSVAGAGSIIGENATVNSDVLIWPGKIIGSGAVVSSDVKYGNVSSSALNENTVDGMNNFGLVPDFCARLGAAVGGAGCKKIGIATDDSVLAQMIKFAFVAGAVSAGSDVRDFGESFESQLNFMVRHCSLDCGVFVSGKEKLVAFCGKDGLGVTRAFERNVQNKIGKGGLRYVDNKEMKRVTDASVMTELYLCELMKICPLPLIGISVSAKCDNEKILSLFNECIRNLGADESEKYVFVFAENGKTFTVETAGKIYSHEKLLAVCCAFEMNLGNDVAVPFDSPEYFDLLSGKAKVLRYLKTPADNSDSKARDVAASQWFSADALFLAMKTLYIIAKTGKNLEELIGDLPERFVAEKIFKINFLPSELSEISGIKADKINKTEGVRLVGKGGVVRMIPDSTGEKVRILAEADSMEAADELCFDAEDMLTKKSILT